MRLDKLVLQSIEASEQCERLDVPRIERFAVSDVQKLSNEFVKMIYSHTEHYFSRRTCISHPPAWRTPPPPRRLLICSPMPHNVQDIKTR